MWRLFGSAAAAMTTAWLVAAARPPNAPDIPVGSDDVMLSPDSEAVVSMLTVSSHIRRWDDRFPVDPKRHGHLSLLGSHAELLSRSFSSLVGLRARSTTASSPELDALMGEIDKKLYGLKMNNISNERCAEMVAAITKHAADQKPQVPLIVHTGMFLDDGAAPFPDAARKLRLGILSFLASQDLRIAELHLWSDAGKHHPVLQEALRPILAKPELAKNVKVKRFVEGEEFARAFPRSPETAALLTKLYGLDGLDEKMLASRSDLQRAVLLNNYGGVWMDTDVLLVSDLTPVSHEDWAYLGQDGWINNAVLSVSRPASPFITAYMAAVVAQGNITDNVYQFGPSMLSLLRDQTRATESGAFHVLPTCFFDGGWTDEQGSVWWDDFFTVTATEQQLAYVDPQQTRHTTLAYHWHGRWTVPISSGSLAERAEKLYMQRLGISA